MLGASTNVSIFNLASEEHQLKEVGNMFLLGVVKDRLFFWYSEGVLKTLDNSMENEESVFTCEESLQLYNIGDKILLKYFDIDRKSTRLNSSHVRISYAVFCLKKKNKKY